MITIYALKGDKVGEISAEEIDKKKFTWVRMLNPNHLEMDDLARITHVPVEEFIEFVEEDERPRFQEEEDYLYLIYKLPNYDEKPITTIPLGIIIKDSIIITIEKIQPIRSIKYIVSLIDKGRAISIFKKDPSYFLHYMFDKINDEFLYVLNKISISKDMLKSNTQMSDQTMEHLYEQNTSLIYIHQAMIANIEVLNNLRKLEYTSFGKQAQNKFEELYYDGLQILDTTRIQRDLMTSMFNFQSNFASNRMNQMLKILTIGSLLMLLPSLITNIFSMNFKYQPLHDSPIGFWIVIAMIIVTAGIFLFAAFRQKWI